jgi:hypothetical protein
LLDESGHAVGPGLLVGLEAQGRKEAHAVSPFEILR